MRRFRRVERRRFARRCLRDRRAVPARILLPDGGCEVLKISILDISEGGLRIEADTPLPQGEFNLAIDASHFQGGFDGELFLPCESVWSRRASSVATVYGLEFVASEQACEVLSRVLSELTEPLEEEEKAGEQTLAGHS